MIGKDQSDVRGASTSKWGCARERVLTGAPSWPGVTVETWLRSLRASWQHCELRQWFESQYFESVIDLGKRWLINGMANKAGRRGNVEEKGKAKEPTERKREGKKRWQAARSGSRAEGVQKIVGGEGRWAKAEARKTRRSSCPQGARVRQTSRPARAQPLRPPSPRLRFLPLLVRDAAAAAAE